MSCQTETFATLKVLWMTKLTIIWEGMLSLAQTVERDDGLHPTAKAVGIRPTIL